MGYRAVNRIMDEIEGKSYETSKILTDVDVIDKSNIDTYEQGGSKFEN